MQTVKQPATKALRILRRTAQAAVAAALLLSSATSCKKKPPVPPAPVSPQGKISAINTSGASSFGTTTWLQQKAAADKNISVSGGKSFAHVTYKPAVKFVDKAAVDASLQGISSDGRGAIFQNASPEIKALKAGDVLLVKGAFAAKIVAAETQGDQTFLYTDYATLADVVQSGELKVDAAVGFHGPRHATVQPPPARPFHIMDLVETPVYAQDGSGAPDSSLIPSHANPKPGLPTDSASKYLGDAVLDQLISGWKVEKYSITPGDNTASINARVTKLTSGFKAAVDVDGSISDFEFDSDLDFSDITPADIIHSIKGMSGTMHVGWQTGKDTPGSWVKEDKIKLPAGISIPLSEFVSGLPLSLEVSILFIIHPALTGGDEYSTGGFTMGWIGSQNSASGGDDEGLTFSVDDDENISPVAPNGMVIEICAPRVELKLAVLGAYGSDRFLKTVAAAADVILDAVFSHIIPADVYAKFKSSPLGNLTVSNALGSQADVYMQVVHIEGVTHSSTMTLAPCSKQQLRILGQVGGDLKLFGLTDKAKTTTDVFDKTFTRWDPGSAFCKAV
jgi:hypothetical protein